MIFRGVDNHRPNRQDGQRCSRCFDGISFVEYHIDTPDVGHGVHYRSYSLQECTEEIYIDDDDVMHSCAMISTCPN